MDNQMEKNMEHEMETGIIRPVYRTYIGYSHTRVILSKWKIKRKLLFSI